MTNYRNTDEVNPYEVKDKERYEEVDTFVTKKECLDAITYLHGYGYVDEMSSDQSHYVNILVKKVARMYKVKLMKHKDDEQASI